MTSLLMLFVLVCGSVLQAILPKWHVLGQAGAPILLGIVLYYAFAHTRGTALWAAILAGLFQDALGMIPLGYSSFCFCIVVLVVEQFRDLVFVHEVLTHMLFGALAAGFVTLILYILLMQGGLITLRAGWGALKIFGSMLLGAVVVPLEFEVLESLDRMLGNVEARES